MDSKIGIMGKSAVIICNGEFPAKEYPRYIIRNADIIVCCDGAFDRYLRHCDSIFGKTRLPDAVIGDMDSISKRKRERYGSIMVHVSDQDTNDQTKAFNHILERWPDVSEIHITGATGIRTDHTIGNISLLMEYARTYDLESKGITVDIISDCETIFPVTDTIELMCGTGRLISVMTPDSTLRIHSEGLVWPLDDVVFDNWWKATLNRAGEDRVKLVFSHRSIALVIMD